MLFYRGLTPSILLVIALLLPPCLWAQQRVPLTIGEAERLALEQEPGLAALHERAAALDEESVAAGQLPDPELRVALLNYPIDSGGFSTEGMTQAQLAYRQRFPAGDSRDYGALKFESLADAASRNADARERELRTRTREAWLEVYYWQRAYDIVTELRPFFSDLVTVTRSLYRVGRKTQHDLLRAELEYAKLDDRLIDIDRRRGQAQSALSRWVGEDAYRTVSASLPPWTEIPSREVLRERLAHHPLVAAADARIAAQDAAVVHAEERKKPGWALDVGYGYREGFQPNGEPRSDFISVAVTFDLPVFSSNRQDRSLAAALRERTATRYDKAELLRGLSSQLDSEYVRWQDLDRRLTLFETEILELSASQAQAALLAYQADAGDFADVIRSFIDDLNTRVDFVRLQVERGQSYAMLDNLGGLSQ